MGSSPQSAPTRSPNKIFVEYNWTSVLKIDVLLVNHVQNYISIFKKYSPKIGHGSVAPSVDRDRRPWQAVG